MCFTECPSGLYGSGCTQICGQCADHASCDSIMGHCPTECSPGWRGTHCNIRKCLLYIYIKKKHHSKFDTKNNYNTRT